VVGFLVVGISVVELGASGLTVVFPGNDGTVGSKKYIHIQ